MTKGRFKSTEPIRGDRSVKPTRAIKTRENKRLDQRVSAFGQLSASGRGMNEKMFRTHNRPGSTQKGRCR